MSCQQVEESGRLDSSINNKGLDYQDGAEKKFELIALPQHMEIPPNIEAKRIIQ